MATTINSLGVNLGMDAKGFIDGSKTSRSEARMLAKDIEAARTPAENLAIAQSRLDKAYHDGAISIEVYNRLLEEQQSKARKAIESSRDRADQLDKENSLFTKLSKAGNIVSGIRDGFDMIGNSIGFVMDKWRAFDEIAEGLDATKDKAEKLGLTFNELGSLQFAAKRLGGDDAMGAIDAAISKMLKNGFVEAGESAVDAFKRAADEIDGMANQTERAQRAAEIFGKGGIELLAVLQSGSDEIENLANQWERTNGLTQSQLEFIGEYNDRWEDVKMAVDGVATVFVAEMAPALTVMAENILGMDTSLVGFRDNARMVSDVIVAMAGNAKDLFEIYSAMSVPQDMSRWAAAADFSSADRMLDDVNAKRLKIETEAGLKEIKAKEDRARTIEEAKLKAAEDASGNIVKSEAESFKDLINGNADAWDSFLEERKNKNELVAKSIEQAERELDRRRKERDKQRQDIAKGPQSLEIGSAESARYLADQVNQQIADQVVSDDGKPTQEQILSEAQKQSELIQSQAATAKEMKAKLEELVDVSKSNGFKRIR